MNVNKGVVQPNVRDLMVIFETKKTVQRLVIKIDIFFGLGIRIDEDDLIFDSPG